MQCGGCLSGPSDACRDGPLHADQRDALLNVRLSNCTRWKFVAMEEERLQVAILVFLQVMDAVTDSRLRKWQGAQYIANSMVVVVWKGKTTRLKSAVIWSRTNVYAGPSFGARSGKSLVPTSEFDIFAFICAPLVLHYQT